MKSQKLLALLLLFSSAMSNAQVHIPFPVKNCSWKHRMVTSCTGLDGGTTIRMFENYPLGDTVIGGKLYVKLYNKLDPDVTSGNCSALFDYTSNSYWGAVRQDDVGLKAYVIPGGQNTELLYYDFTLTVGDTLKTYQTEKNWGPPRIVDSIYYQPFSDNICRKVYRFTGPAFTFQSNGNYYHFDEIIEGIGMTSGLYQMNKSASFYNNAITMVWTMTLEINGSPILRTNDPCKRDVGLPEQQQPGFQIWPNPGNDVINIKSVGTSRFQFTIIDIYGREVLRSELPVMNTESLLPGIYFIRCNDQRNRFTIVHRWIKI
jgi:hypothetical protein